MAPVAERLVPAEPAAAELDLPRDLGRGWLDRVTGIVHDHDRAFDDDRAGRLEGDPDRRRGGGGVGAHDGSKTEGRKDAKTQRRKDAKSTRGGGTALTDHVASSRPCVLPTPSEIRAPRPRNSGTRPLRPEAPWRSPER